MLTLSDSAKHTASLSRIALTEYEKWWKVTQAFYPTAMKARTTDYLVEYYIDGGEDALALWHHEYQMGYIVLTPINNVEG